MDAERDPYEGSSSKGHALQGASSSLVASSSEGHALQGASTSEDPPWIEVTKGIPLRVTPKNRRAEITGPMHFACPSPEGYAHDNRRVRFSEEPAEIHEFDCERSATFIPVTNGSSFQSYRQAEMPSEMKCQKASVAAIQRAVDLAEGNSMTYDDLTWEAEDAYKGSVKKQGSTNDNRLTPILWSKRHCRKYVDPWKDGAPHGRSAIESYFKICTVDGRRIDGIDNDNYYYLCHLSYDHRLYKP